MKLEAVESECAQLKKLNRNLRSQFEVLAEANPLQKVHRIAEKRVQIPAYK